MTNPDPAATDALVEEMAQIIYEQPEGQPWSLIRDPDVKEWHRGLARALLPILTAREAAAREQGRREGIEAAAKVAAMFVANPPPRDRKQQIVEDETSRQIAVAIRQQEKENG